MPQAFGLFGGGSPTRSPSLSPGPAPSHSGSQYPDRSDTDADGITWTWPVSEEVLSAADDPQQIAVRGMDVLEWILGFAQARYEYAPTANQVAVGSLILRHLPVGLVSNLVSGVLRVVLTAMQDMAR